MITALGWFLIGVYGAAMLFIFAYSMIQLNLVWSYLTKKKKDKAVSISEDQYPFVTIQLPLYNEQYVVKRLIKSVSELIYPEDKLEIQILDDSSDETTKIVQEEIDNLGERGKIFKLVRRPDRIGYKAGALKYGLEIAKGDYVGIFDADFLPKSDFLLKMIPYLVKDEKLGVVQSRWTHINEDYSLLTKLQGFGLDAHFVVEQGGRNFADHFINFNGTAGIWRKDCILDAGNWEADTLTEDLDLSYRAQLKGWKFKYLEDVESPAELPTTMNALKSQQFRWTKGAAETAIKNLSRVYNGDIKLSTKLHSSFHLLNSVIFICVLLTSILSVPLLIFKNEFTSFDLVFKIASVFLVSLLSLGLFYWTSFFRLEKITLKNIIKFFFTFPVFLSISMGLSLHNSIAVLEGLFGVKSAFIRTPKFNIIDNKDPWRNSLYRITKINKLTIVEGLLALYFLVGIYTQWVYQDFALLAFHGMLFLGYSTVCFYSVKHAKFA